MSFENIPDFQLGPVTDLAMTVSIIRLARIHPHALRAHPVETGMATTYKLDTGEKKTK